MTSLLNTITLRLQVHLLALLIVAYQDLPLFDPLPPAVQALPPGEELPLFDPPARPVQSAIPFPDLFDRPGEANVAEAPMPPKAEKPDTRHKVYVWTTTDKTCGPCLKWDAARLDRKEGGKTVRGLDATFNFLDGPKEFPTKDDVRALPTFWWKDSTGEWQSKVGFSTAANFEAEVLKTLKPPTVAKNPKK
jgi:hypothetical protein